MKIGQGEYTENEIKEESELELKETLTIKCPTCDTPFNKYHKKCILTFDSMICPTCKARYEIIPPNSYKFINIPDKNSKLWEHYTEQLTIEEIYNVFDKELSTPITNSKKENLDAKKETEQQIKNLPSIKNKDSINYIDKFKEEMLSHDLKTSNLNCPLCENIMQMYEESGLLSKSTYHYCEKCQIKFNGKKDSLSIEEAPINTRLSEDLMFKHWPLEKWKNILHFGLTDYENRKISELKKVGTSTLFCPSCNCQFEEYENSGLRSSDYLICSGCLMRLKKIQIIHTH